jgi:predicted membrane channel-forming protein YqfA (hemolysin III family)
MASARQRFKGAITMAINETYTPVETVAVQSEAAYTRRPLFPAVRWGAVLAGVAVGISVQLVLTMLGVATGLSTTNVAQGETVGMGPLLWAGFSMLVAAFVGGYVAARMSGLKRKADGVLHGAVSWAVTTILFAVLATSIGGTLVSSVFGNLSQIASASASSGGGSPLATLLRSQNMRMDAATMKQLQQYLQSGQRDQAVQLITSRTGADPSRVSGVVDQALIISGSPQAASPQGQQTANTALHGAGAAAWVVFAAVALALAIGIGGGALGAAGSRRVSWAGGVAPRA